MNLNERIEQKLVDLDLIERYGTDIDGMEHNNDNSREIEGIKQLIRDVLKYVTSDPRHDGQLVSAEKLYFLVSDITYKAKELGLYQECGCRVDRQGRTHTYDCPVHSTGQTTTTKPE